MTQRLLGQLGKGELFAVLAPGFYMFVVFYSIALSSASEPARSLWAILGALAIALQENPISILFVGFMAYLLGSLARAIPVSFAERVSPPFRSDFPYPETLKEVVEELSQHRPGTAGHLKAIPKLTEGAPLVLYNYWKSVICHCSESAFEYYRGFEIRVRFFSGVIWAALVGVLGSAYLAVSNGTFFNSSALHLAVISVCLLIAFGGYITRVRRQEAKILLITYMAVLQERSEQVSRSPMSKEG